MPSTTSGAVPQPASAMPSAINATGAVGGMTGDYARADHTHQSRLRKARLSTAADGSLTWVFTNEAGDPAPFAAGVTPMIMAIAETADGVTDVVNVQVEGVPTNTQAKIRVTRTARSVVALIGLTVLSIPGNPGVTTVHLWATANA
jgi:hypothetical protein